MPPTHPNWFRFELPVKYMQTQNEEDFLREDSVVPVSVKRYLVFASSKNIDFLNSYGSWFIDRAFKSWPENFYHVYTVHCFVDGTTFPCIYELPDKRQYLYNALWSKLKSNVKAAVSVMMDFEMASINSVGDNFPETKIKVFFFSFFSIYLQKDI